MLRSCSNLSSRMCYYRNGCDKIKPLDFSMNRRIKPSRCLQLGWAIFQSACLLHSLTNKITYLYHTKEWSIRWLSHPGSRWLSASRYLSMQNKLQSEENKLQSEVNKLQSDLGNISKTH